MTSTLPGTEEVAMAESTDGSKDQNPEQRRVVISAASEGGFLEISEEVFDEASAAGRIHQIGLRDDGAIIYTLDDVTAGTVYEGTNIEHPATSEAERQKNAVVVALPKKGHPVHDMGPEEKHVTLAFLGEHDGDLSDVHEHVKKTAESMAPFEANVSGKGELGPDKAKVALLEHPSFAEARSRTLLHPDVADAVNKADSHPHFVPHMTMGYGDDDGQHELPDKVPFDRLAVWHGDKRTEHPLGGAKPAEKAAAALGEGKTYAEAAQAAFAAQEPAQEPMDWAEPEDDDQGPTPFHVVLAPETVESGDGRTFNKDALTHRPLPIPLTWQKTSAEGHDGNVTVCRVERIKKVMLPSVDTGELVPMQVGDGHFLSSVPETDEAVGLIGEFGRFGVSVDGDRVVASVNEDAGQVEFSEARTSSACIVAIPAFAEAYIALGPAPAEWGMDDPDEEATQEALVASGMETFKRGPGWITNPEATRRIHAYWTKPGEPGYVKIGWGVPHDFYRCRDLVGKEIAKHSPESSRFINQICAQWHKDALGYYPAQHKAGEVTPFAYESLELEDRTPAAALTLVASGGIEAPADWFVDPEFGAPGEDPRLVQDKEGRWASPLRVTREGQVFGHIARWETCHIGFGKTCTVAPHSKTDYGFFLYGATLLDDGTEAAVGHLSIGGGHAPGHFNLARTLAHYDSTSTAAADVTCGEDQYGVWVAGWVRPGVSDEMVVALRASAISGDWRPVGPGGGLELVAALAVNVPGFGVPRARIAAANGRQLSLVAAGCVPPSEEALETVAAYDPDGLGHAIAQEVVATLTRREEMRALAAARQSVKVGQ